MYRNEMMSSYLALWENSLVTSPPSEGVQRSGPAAERHYSAITQRGFQLAAYEMCSSSARKSFLLVNTRLFAHMLARSVPPSAHVSSAWVGLWDRDSLYGAELRGPQSNCNSSELWIFSVRSFFHKCPPGSSGVAVITPRTLFFSLFCFSLRQRENTLRANPNSRTHTHVQHIQKHTLFFFLFFLLFFYAGHLRRQENVK